MYAMTQAEQGEATFIKGDSVHLFAVEPRTHFVVMSARQDLNGGASQVSAILTATGRDLPANTILQLDEQLRNMPLDDLERIAKLLLPVAGLGSQGEGTSKTKGTGMTFGLAL
jgi:hypothetical protein